MKIITFATQKLHSNLYFYYYLFEMHIETTAMISVVVSILMMPSLFQMNNENRNQL